MSIGFQLDSVPFKLTAEDMGYFSPIKAMDEGVNSKKLSQDLLSKILSNKMQKIESDYYEPFMQNKLNQSEQNLLRAKIINKYLPQEKQLGIGDLQQQIIKNTLLNKYLPQEKYLEMEDKKQDILRNKLLNNYIPQENILKQNLLQSKILNLNPGQKMSAAVIGKNQKAIQSIDNIIPILNSIIKDKNGVPSQLYGGIFDQDNQKKYIGKVNQSMDLLLGAFGLNPSDYTAKSVKEIVSRGALESQSAYKKRINDVIEDLKNKRQYSVDLLQGKRKITDDQNTLDSNKNNIDDAISEFFLKKAASNE